MTGLTFDPRRHVYLLDGQRVPSVTQILDCISKPFLVEWYGRLGTIEAKRQAREAADHGTAVHAACEGLALGHSVSGYPPGVVPFVETYAKWFGANVRRVIHVEVILGSRAFQYAGCADLVAELTDGSLAVIDLKTSAGVDETFGAQLSAYAHALKEQEGLAVERRLVVRMPRKEPGKLDVHEFTSPDDWRAFLAASILFERYFKAAAFAPPKNIIGRYA